MEHLLSGSLPGCESLQQAEEHHRVDAMQMELRERRVRHPDWNVSIRDVERHLDLVCDTDSDVYVTCLYVKSRMGVIFSHLSDEQVRNAFKGIDLAMSQLYHDYDVIRPAVREYRQEGHAFDSMLGAVRDRITALLPKMLSIVAEHAKKEVEAIPRRPAPVMDGSTGKIRFLDNVYYGGVDAEASLPPAIAEAAMRLRALGCQRHPIDLVREISAWLMDMESSE